MTDLERRQYGENERALVSGALVDTSVRHGSGRGVESYMFADVVLGRVWLELARVLDLEPELPPIGVAERVAAGLDGEVTQIDLVSMADGLSAANASYYALRVREGYARRRLEAMANPDLLRRGADLGAADLLAGVEGEAAALRGLLAPRRSRLPEVMSGDRWLKEVPLRRWLVDGWLPAGELAMLTGPGSEGKGKLAMQLGAALACDRGPLELAGGWLPSGGVIGAEAPGLCPEPVPVVIAGWEDTADEHVRVRGRLRDYGGCGWIAHPSINSRLHVVPMRGYGPLWGPSESGSRHVATVGVLTETGAALLSYAEGVGAQLLVVDPAGMAILVNENDRALVSVALDALAGWAMRTGCAVLVVAHPAKAKDGEAADYAGSTAWRGSVRALWTLRMPDKREVDRDSGDWQWAVGDDPKRPERIAHLSRNKNNYDWDGDFLTIKTRGGRAGWELIDPLPRPSRRKRGLIGPFEPLADESEAGNGYEPPEPGDQI